MQQYIDFLRDAVIMNKVALKYDNDMYGILATDDIKSGDLLIKVKHEYSINAFTVFQDEKCNKIIKDNPHIYPSLQEISNKKSDFQILILYLMVQRNGYLKPIFDISQHPTCILDCDIKIEFQFLEDLRQQFQEQYDSEKQEILQIGFTSQEYDWAYRYCMNRRLSVNNDYPFSFLVPMIDMINHGVNMAIFGLEQENQKDEQYALINESKLNFLLVNKYYFSQEIQEELIQIKPKETQQCSKKLKKLLLILFQEFLSLNQKEVWELNLLEPNDSDDESLLQEQLDPIEKGQKIKAQVDDDYLKDYYEQTLDQCEHDWYSQIKETQCQAYLTVRAVDDIDKGDEVLNLYGCVSNEHLLMYYGFALQKNKYDRVKFRIHMDCIYKEDFIKNIEKHIFLHHVTYQDVINGISYQANIKQLTNLIVLKKSKFNMDLIKVLQTYCSILEGNEQINEELIIHLYKQIIIYLIVKFEQIIINGVSYWQQQLQNYQISKLKILRSHLEMTQNVFTNHQQMPIKVFMKLREYLKKR